MRTLNSLVLLMVLSACSTVGTRDWTLATPQFPKGILMQREPVFITCEWIDHDNSWRKEDIFCYPDGEEEYKQAIHERIR